MYLHPITFSHLAFQSFDISVLDEGYSRKHVLTKLNIYVFHVDYRTHDDGNKGYESNRQRTSLPAVLL